MRPGSTTQRPRPTDSVECSVVRVIGVPMDLGQQQRGVDMGPSAIRYAGLSPRLSRLGYRVDDRGNLPVPAHVSVPREHLVATIRTACEVAYREAEQAVSAGHTPLFLGGDHTVALGTVGGVSHSRRCGLIWIDAHGDFNTPETTTTGNVHGMPLAALLGRGDPELTEVGRAGPKVHPDDVVAIGLRQLDPTERQMLKQSGMGLFTMRDIDERGLSEVLHTALDQLAHLPCFHVSLDMDAIDPVEAPGVGTPVRGGLTYREAQLLMEIVADSGKLGSMDVVEVNPVLDHENRTARMAVELVASALGKRIL